MEKTTIPVNIEGLPCAIPSENEQLFTWYDSQKSFGVCFLYPLDFIKRNTEIPGNIFLTGVSYGGRELSSASMEIDIEPANGLTTEEFAQNAAAKAGPGLESTLYQIILPDDVTAMKTESLPGQAASRTIYVVNNDVAFTLTFMPLDQTNQDAWVDMERIYSLFSLTWEFTR
ncbi:MAG: hypothetical protein Q8S01_00575 [Ignavibacteria bacterium]|nr:hypothetical protein [Ignavibacteria bacterium]